MPRPLIVTHHAPDLDACCSVWILKRFDGQHFADAKVAFVNPGDSITLEEAETYGSQLHEVTQVDTGLGEFDHHQSDRGLLPISASSLVHDHVCKVHPELEHDQALKVIVEFTTEIDHFGEVRWPEANSLRYSFMIQELLRGMEFTDPHNDESQLHFGMTCLDCAYATLTQRLKAVESITEEGQPFEIKPGKALAITTRNDDTIKEAQRQGYVLVIKKDPQAGHIRIKARPDVDITLKPLSDRIAQVDTKGTWYFHPSGKMLINGSHKHRNQTPSPLSLDQVVELIKELYT